MVRILTADRHCSPWVGGCQASPAAERPSRDHGGVGRVLGRPRDLDAVEAGRAGAVGAVSAARDGLRKFWEFTRKGLNIILGRRGEEGLKRSLGDGKIGKREKEVRISVCVRKS